jgi:hypothetical protein
LCTIEEIFLQVHLRYAGSQERSEYLTSAASALRTFAANANNVPLFAVRIGQDIKQDSTAGVVEVHAWLLNLSSNGKLVKL